VKIALSRRGDYAVRAVLHLAKLRAGARSKARAIAQDMAIPEKYVPQVLTGLVRGGIVESVSGPDGGYSLTRAPERITLREVVELTEGPIQATECILRGGPCRWDDACAVHAVWSAATQAFERQLDDTTFAALAQVDRALDEG
jgi:Rrf2 family transcriptional regulator, iron-sulfur cluster assembly transcription factor